MKSHLIALAFASLAALPTVVVAADVNCPTLSSAVQVATCPAEEELKYTYIGYCGDNVRLYGKDKDTCESYASYRKVKNVVMWESADGQFHAYLSCDLDPAAIKAAKPQRISVGKVGKLTRVACDYGNDIVFAHRTRSECQVEGAGTCATDVACQVTCN